ncbi:hypothetical protein [Hyphomicrobium sp.]|uniref:hypothetical protein n=1 Tax=Hyphomicrobium sp. TaxID=82 RepID=UPI0025C5F657|nr:hypothetical protein [Hyphomicrobium sp.]MCC7252884.1 hypothetical protein [Hyphomicrobium sp.]
MHSYSRLVAALPRTVLLIGCMVLLTAWKLGPPVTFFDEEGGIARAVETLRAKVGFERIVSIAAGETSVSIEAQEPFNNLRVGRWTLRKESIELFGWEFHWEELNGPEPVEFNLVDPDAEARLFDIKEVDFTAADGLMKEALARAALEDQATVESIEIRRQHFRLPAALSGSIRWSVAVRSGRESATIFADAKGGVAGMDLTHTNKGRAFDLLASLDRLPEAARDFAEVVGTGPVLAEARITSRGVGFKTKLEEKTPDFGFVERDQRQTFDWGINGLTRSTGTSGFFARKPPFAVTETDWSLAPSLVRKARDALNMPDAAVDNIEIAKPEGQPGTPRLEWKVALAEKGEKGVARFDAKGELIWVTLPESRRKPFDGRDPAVWPALLSQIEASFGGESILVELVIHDEHISIAVDDPQNPKEPSQFLLDENGIRQFGTASLFEMPNPRFSVSDLKALDEAQMRKLQEVTAQRLRLSVANITTIVIGRSSLDPSSQGNVTVEIRAEEAPFQRSGRVNWEIDGREIKAYLP